MEQHKLMRKLGLEEEYQNYEQEKLKRELSYDCMLKADIMNLKLCRSLY